MKYTFEISIAGCETECAHCYVSGGRAPAIQFDDYTKAMTKLKTILDKIDKEIFVTLGNEVFTHQRISDIIIFTYDLMPLYFSYEDFDIPTTGITFGRRTDIKKVIKALRTANCSGFGLTLHGGKENHNWITRNNTSFDSIKTSAEMICNEGFNVTFNLMLSKFLVSDWPSVCEIIGCFPKTDVRLTIPLYLPIDRLRIFQQYRAEYDDCMKLEGRLADARINELDFINKILENNEKRICKNLLGGGHIDYKEEYEKTPEWAFFNITQSFDIYYGNVGLHTQLIGNLMRDSSESLHEKIISLPKNYDWSAFYNLDKLPPIQSVLQKITPLKTNYVYPSSTECFYSWLDGIGIPSTLLTQ